MRGDTRLPDSDPSPLVITPLAERPDLAGHLDDFPGAWPEFMNHDPVSAVLYDTVVARYPEFTMVGVDRADPHRLVAKVCAMPFTWPGDPDQTWPPGGYDTVVLTAAADAIAGRPGTLVAAVEMVVDRGARGRGISALMLQALRRNAVRLGFGGLVVPVRPNRKSEHPRIPMAEYLTWTREDGLPADPWLRVHLRAGARIAGIAPRSMVISGSLGEWRSWTGLPFDQPGPVEVPGALTLVHCDLDRGLASYVEPNVWVHHPLA